MALQGTLWSFQVLRQTEHHKVSCTEAAYWRINYYFSGGFSLVVDVQPLATYWQTSARGGRQIDRPGQGGGTTNFITFRYVRQGSERGCGGWAQLRGGSGSVAQSGYVGHAVYASVGRRVNTHKRRRAHSLSTCNGTFGRSSLQQSHPCCVPLVPDNVPFQWHTCKAARAPAPFASNLLARVKAHIVNLVCQCSHQACGQKSE
eukprot:4955155-Pleurochrysis_carterae.AAC.1